MGTVIQDMPHINHRSQPRWDRFERADLLEQYRQLRTQGISERQAAQELKVPRTTLQAWRLWHDTLDICPNVAEFFQSGPGLAFLHRLVIACHLVGLDQGIGHFMLFEADSVARAPAPPTPMSPRTSSVASDRKSAPQPSFRQAA